MVWFACYFVCICDRILELTQKKRGCVHMVYPYHTSLSVCFWNVLAFSTGNSAFTVILQVYFPSTLFVFVFFSAVVMELSFG